MTLFDWCIIGFIPIAALMITTQFALHGWDIRRVMFGDEEEEEHE